MLSHFVALSLSSLLLLFGAIQVTSMADKCVFPKTPLQSGQLVKQYGCATEETELPAELRNVVKVSGDGNLCVAFLFFHKRFFRSLLIKHFLFSKLFHMLWSSNLYRLVSNWLIECMFLKWFDFDHSIASLILIIRLLHFETNFLILGLSFFLR